MESGEGVGVYAEAKSEYTKQLCQYIVPSMQQYFLDLLEEAKQKEADPKRVLVMFQTLLEDISDWNVDKVQRETDAIVATSHCDYLEELMTAVFIAHTKVLSAIRLTTKQKKLQITIPKLDHFIHRILRECSRLLWSNTYLFSTSAPSIERQKNLRIIENFLQEGVLQGIRGMLPVKNILREYLKEDDEEKEEAKVDDEDAEEKDEKKDTEAEKKDAEAEKKDAEAEDEEKAESQTIIVPTTPISFTGSDTLEEKEDTFDDVEPGPESEEIKILDEPPEPMDEPDDFEAKGEELLMDFESLE
jgi:hypothetical protein